MTVVGRGCTKMILTRVVARFVSAGKEIETINGLPAMEKLGQDSTMETKKKPFLPPKSAFIYFLIFMEIFGRLQYRLCLLILGFYRVSIYINVSLGDVFVVCVFWKVLTSLKSIYPSSSTSIRRVMPCLSRCFSVPKFVSQRIQPRWFRVQLLQNPAFNYAYKSLGRKFPKQRSGIGERFFVNR